MRRHFTTANRHHHCDCQSQTHVDSDAYPWHTRVMQTHLERAHQRLINTHHGSGVVKLSTVVRCWEQSHQLTLGKELVAIFYHLSITQTTHMHIQPPVNTVASREQIIHWPHSFFIHHSTPDRGGISAFMPAVRRQYPCMPKLRV